MSSSYLRSPSHVHVILLSISSCRVYNFQSIPLASYLYHPYVVCVDLAFGCAWSVVLGTLISLGLNNSSFLYETLQPLSSSLLPPAGSGILSAGHMNEHVTKCLESTGPESNSPSSQLVKTYTSNSSTTLSKVFQYAKVGPTAYNDCTFLIMSKTSCIVLIYLKDLGCKICILNLKI